MIHRTVIMADTMADDTAACTQAAALRRAPVIKQENPKHKNQNGNAEPEEEFGQLFSLLMRTA